MSLGLALQLTNIIRDVAVDLQSGRVYLPVEDLARWGVQRGQICELASTSEAVKALLKFECDRARDFYRRAAAERPEVDRHSLVAAEIMGAIYFEILQANRTQRLRRVQRPDTGSASPPRGDRSAVWLRSFF